MDATQAIVQQIADEVKARFNEAAPILQDLISKRKGSWTLTTVMEWQDVSSIILTKLYNNFWRYDPTRPLNHWANVVITNELKNLIRNNLVRYLKPCSAANNYGARCSFNEGANRCGWTKSGVQDSSCRFYAAWEKKKKDKYAIATPLSLDDEGPDEGSPRSMHDTLPSDPGNFIDIEGAKKVIDAKMLKLLNKEEGTIYRLLYIKHLSPEAVGKKMGYKKQQNSDIPGYLKLKKSMAKFREMAEGIVSREGLA